MVLPQGLFCCGQGGDRMETLLNCSFILAGIFLPGTGNERV